MAGRRTARQDARPPLPRRANPDPASHYRRIGDIGVSREIILRRARTILNAITNGRTGERGGTTSPAPR
jgi:hypothetical protein